MVLLELKWWQNLGNKLVCWWWLPPCVPVLVPPQKLLTSCATPLPLLFFPTSWEDGPPFSRALSSKNGCIGIVCARSSYIIVTIHQGNQEYKVSENYIEIYFRTSYISHISFRWSWRIISFHWFQYPEVSTGRPFWGHGSYRREDSTFHQRREQSNQRVWR